jgi:hypothetical protein
MYSNSANLCFSVDKQHPLKLIKENYYVKEKIKGAQQQLCRNLRLRTTSTVTISWHYLTRSTSLKYSAKDSCFVINLEIRLGPNVLYFFFFSSKFRMHRRCKGLRCNTFIIQRSCEDRQCTLVFHARCESLKI